MKKFKINGFLSFLSILVLLSAGMVGASTGVASHDEYCNASKEEFFMEEHVWAKVIIYDWVNVTKGILWVCPCSWWGKRMDQYPGCQKRVENISIPGGYIPNGYAEYCANLGLASTMYNASPCKCYDIIFDVMGDGGFNYPDSVDEVGIDVCTPENGCVSGLPNGLGKSAGFHIYSEASTIVLVLSGLVLLFGYIIRKRKYDQSYKLYSK